MSKIDSLISDMWNDYIKMVPTADKIVNLLKNRGEDIVNDHIALRTFNLSKVNVDVIAKPFLDSGYIESGDYHFEQKKLYAKHYEHPDSNKPKVFISELLVQSFSENFQKIVSRIVSDIDDNLLNQFNFITSGRSWNLTSEEYDILDKESSYGSWLASIGYRPNHFTIFINALKKFNEVSDLNLFLKSNGIKLNESGGEVKGSPEVFLEQSSTLADQIEIKLSDKSITIPSCYFEFAKRYKMDNGKVYQGFVAGSADKIFESTSKGQ